MGAAQSAGTGPLAWLRTPVTILVMLVSNGINWQDPRTLMTVRAGFIMALGTLAFVMYTVKTQIQQRQAADEEYRERKVWVRQKPAKTFMASLFGDDGSTARPKASEYKEMTEAGMEVSAAEKGLSSVMSPGLMALGASFVGGIHVLMVLQMVNVPFTMLGDRLLKRHFWPVVFAGDDDAARPGLETLFVEDSDFLRADPEHVPPMLQLVRRRARARRVKDGKDPSEIPDEGADASEGLGGRKPTATTRRLEAGAGPGGSADDGAAGDAPDSADADLVTYGEGYDEVMEDVIFGAWEDDEAINVRAVEALAEQKRPLGYRTDDDGWSLLMVACGSRATPQRAVERLLELGCGKPGDADGSGWTALHWAARHDCPQAVRAVGRWVLGRVLPGQACRPSEAMRLLRLEDGDGRSPEDAAEAEGHAAAAAALAELRRLAERLVEAEGPTAGGRQSEAAEADVDEGATQPGVRAAAVAPSSGAAELD